MNVVVGSDERCDLVGHIERELASRGHQVRCVANGDPWPEVGRLVGEAVAGGDADLGIACCWTGTGVAIAANKVRGVRAALCPDGETARGARKWNDANVLALSLRLTTPAVADEILGAFLETQVDEDEIRTIRSLESG